MKPSGTRNSTDKHQTPSTPANRSELPRPPPTSPSGAPVRLPDEPATRLAPATTTSYNRTTLVQHHGTGSVTLDTTWSAPLKPPTSTKANQPWILLAPSPPPTRPRQTAHYTTWAYTQQTGANSA